MQVECHPGAHFEESSPSLSTIRRGAGIEVTAVDASAAQVVIPVSGFARCVASDRRERLPAKKCTTGGAVHKQASAPSVFRLGAVSWAMR